MTPFLVRLNESKWYLDNTWFWDVLSTKLFKWLFLKSWSIALSQEPAWAKACLKARAPKTTSLWAQMQRICQAFRFNGTRPETLRDRFWQYNWFNFDLSLFHVSFLSSSTCFILHRRRMFNMCCLEILIPAKPSVQGNITVPEAVFVGNPATTTLCVWPLESLLPTPFANVYVVVRLLEGELVELVEPMKSVFVPSIPFVFAWFLVSFLFLWPWIVSSCLPEV